MAVRKPTPEERRYFEKTAAAKAKGGVGTGKTLAWLLEEAGHAAQVIGEAMAGDRTVTLVNRD